MTADCTHKPAAASINWFAGLLKGKGGQERKTVLLTLSEMLLSMKRDNCDPCPSRADCHELDKAMKAVSEIDVPLVAAQQGPVGPLSMKRDHARRTRLIRPHGK